ncbi:MAG: DUF3516 domain-containing protein, partial [Actinomycetota bacterium]
LALDPLTRDEKDRVKDAIGGFRFDSPIGKDLRRFVTAGVCVHHAGLLPKYRMLVERLAQDGLLKIICGTDTLGVGVNVPIRSVLFTQLCKYDGTSVRILSNREFAQIAGRAGRKGFDDRGDAWVQAPPHVVENLRADEKAASSNSKKKPVKKKAPERGYAHWDEAVFDKLVGGAPEALRSHFAVTHQMVMSLLDRPVTTVHRADGTDVEVDGCGALRHLLTDNHETRRRQRGHIRRAISMYRSLAEAGVLEFLDEPDEFGRRVRVTVDLHDDFALHRPLSLWALSAVLDIADGRGPSDGGTDADGLVTALDVLTVIESVTETPGVVVAAQLDRVRDELMAEMKSSGVEYEERMEKLAEAEPPRPNAEWLYGGFNEFRRSHPWVGGDTVAPKSVVREMFERAMTFGEYISHYGLKRSEGVLLRYLSDVYKGLVQTIPDDARSDDLDDVTAWLGALVRQVDSSLIDEWERLIAPDDGDDGGSFEPVRPGHATRTVDDERGFRIMVRNVVFSWIEKLATGQRVEELPEADDQLAPFWDEHDEILTGPDARAGALFSYDAATGEIRQTLLDPESSGEWRIAARVDRERSAEEGRPVIVDAHVGSAI